MSAAVALHILAAVTWVGGMFFAVQVLRPAAGGLEPKDRLPLWGRVFEIFFAWVWASVVLLLVTGYWMIFGRWGGFERLPVYLHLMHAIGLVMVLVYLHLWFAPYRRFRAALAEGDTLTAAKNLTQIRWIVSTNLILGLANAVVGASGRYW